MCPVCTLRGTLPLPPIFHQVLILKEDKVVCFDTLLEVLILKGVALHQNCAKWGFSPFVLFQVFILKGFKLPRMNSSVFPRSVASKGAMLHQNCAVTRDFFLIVALESLPSPGTNGQAANKKAGASSRTSHALIYKATYTTHSHKLKRSVMH